MALKIVVLLKILQMVVSISIEHDLSHACVEKGGILLEDECFIVSGEGDVSSWGDALEKCPKKYGPLASPPDPINLLRFAARLYPGIPFWVAGYSGPYEKSFRWINGTQIPEHFPDFPWAIGEPTPADQPSDERCMLVNYKDGYANKPCYTDHRYICSLDACGILGGATLGYQCLSFNTNQTATWEDAIGECTLQGGNLAVPAYPQLLLDYVFDNFGDDRFWVGALQTIPSSKDSWYWLNGQHIPLGYENFPWGPDQPFGTKYRCLETSSYYLEAVQYTGYNNENCNFTKRFICELDTSSTPPPSHVKFVIQQISSEKYIGPETVFPHIQNNDDVILHFRLDPNMIMTFDIVDDKWGYIRHVITGKILTPMDSGDGIKPINPADGTKVVLQSDRRPWALFAIDQYQNRVIHRSSGKFISSDGKYVTITGDESENQTMEFQFMNPNSPKKEVLPYGYPVISGNWRLVFSVLNSESTHTYSAKVTIGISESLSSSQDFKFGFEVAKNKRTSKHTSSCLDWPWSRWCTGSSSSSGTDTTHSISLEMQQASSDTWNSARTHEFSFTVDAGKSVAVWQRIFIAEHMGHKAVHLSNMFADTDSSRIKPDNFNLITTVLF